MVLPKSNLHQKDGADKTGVALELLALGSAVAGSVGAFACYWAAGYGRIPLFWADRAPLIVFFLLLGFGSGFGWIHTGRPVLGVAIGVTRAVMTAAATATALFFIAPPENQVGELSFVAAVGSYVGIPIASALALAMYTRRREAGSRRSNPGGVEQRR